MPLHQRSRSMRQRRPLAAKVAAAASVALSLVLVTGCVGGSSDGDGDDKGKDSGKDGGRSDSGKGPQALASTNESILYFDSKIDILGLNRTPDDLIFVEFSITNTGDSAGSLYNEMGEPESGADKTPSGISLIDTKNMKHYQAQTYKDQICYCKPWDSANLAPGETLESWVAFPAPPAGVKELNIAFPITAPFLNVPVSEGEAPEEPTAALADPRVRDLRSIEEDLESGTSRDESEDELNLMLSSDVLFDLNKSELTSKADSTLEDVAKEIDSASATTVNIDGYTDNSGNDSINQPLSEKRAESVKKKLSDLVTRDGITFKTEGHGSADPVADNGTKSGQEKNRRVTVRFKK